MRPAASRADGPMNLLSCISGNVPEWQDCFDPPGERPRLPLPYAFGAACSSAGFTLSALDFSGLMGRGADLGPFRALYPRHEIDRALAETDLAVFWGGDGMRQSLRQALRPMDQRQIAFLTYGWHEKGVFTLSRRANLLATRFAARFARCVVAMTAEQARDARQSLPSQVGVVPLSVGIDTRYYAHHAKLADVPTEHRATVERLLQKPYVILPGDELRLNVDALDVIEATGLRLVRVSQYGYKSGTNGLKEEIVRRGLSERVVVFERISYAFLRVLLQNAAAYAGFVDATWQPAGWTVVCESLASGLPVVMYDGYVARELVTLGIPSELCRIVPIGDRAAFGRELITLAKAAERDRLALLARRFAAEHIDLEKTGPVFATALRAVLDGAT
jgi:glycosyltransferase involved in cell wall biosynthesis